MKIIYIEKISTPICDMLAMATDKGLCALEFVDEKRASLWEGRRLKRFADYEQKHESHPHIEAVKIWLEKYFTGQWEALPDLALDQRGSSFEVLVWKKMLKIPRGETRTYGVIAKQVGKPKGARAVGAASRRNPIAIVVPCHRIVGVSNLTGYGGGLPNKAFLLHHEGKAM